MDLLPFPSDCRGCPFFFHVIVAAGCASDATHVATWTQHNRFHQVIKEKCHKQSLHTHTQSVGLKYSETDEFLIKSLFSPISTVRMEVIYKCILSTPLTWVECINFHINMTLCCRYYTNWPWKNNYGKTQCTKTSGQITLTLKNQCRWNFNFSSVPELYKCHVCSPTLTGECWTCARKDKQPSHSGMN